MICNLIRFIAFVQLLAFCSAKCEAAVIWTYDLADLGSTRTLGNPFSLAKTSLNEGLVFFTATLVVTGTSTSGSSDIGYQELALNAGGPGVNLGGLGVDGNTLNGGSGTESLRFAVQLSEIVGGSVVFNGFSTVGFNGFGSSVLGELSLDNSYATTGDNTRLDDVNGTLPLISVPNNAAAFSIFSNAGHFQVSYVTGSFTTTAAAVPEPSAFAVFVIVASAAPLLRRFRRRTNSVDSGSLVA